MLPIKTFNLKKREMYSTIKLLKLFKNNLTRKKFNHNYHYRSFSLTYVQNVNVEKKYDYVRKKLLMGPTLKDFLKKEHVQQQQQDSVFDEEFIPYLQDKIKYGQHRKVYFDVYGCQMNVNDTEIIWSILKSNKFLKTNNINEADVVLIVTCAIREGAENKIWNRLSYLNGIRKNREKSSKNRPKMKIGILGCMAERLKEKVLIFNL